MTRRNSFRAPIATIFAKASPVRLIEIKSSKASVGQNSEFRAVHTEAVAAQDRARARYARRQVIAAKDRARFLSRSPRTPAEKKAQKEEMVQWMLVWLENPEVFPAWAAARKRVKP